MIFADFAKKAQRLVTSNSPAILTAIGVTGTVMTAILTGKASFRAAEIIEENEPVIGIRRNTETNEVEPDTSPLDPRQKIDLVWKLYVPAVGTAVMTIVCIIAANRIGSRRVAGLAAAYSLSEKAISEYQGKIVDTLGKKKEQAVRDELAQEKITKNPVENREIIIAGGGNVLCFDAHSGRYFLSDHNTLMKAMNDINQRVVSTFFVPLSEFYDEIGLARTTSSDEIGWSVDKLLDLQISGAVSTDGRPCLSMSFHAVPMRGHHELNHGS